MVYLEPKVRLPSVQGIQDWWDGWMKSREEGKKLDAEINEGIIEHGTGLADTWATLAYQEPPEDFWGRLLWSAGVIIQVIVLLPLFPAALGCFLLEEAVQTYGMGAYMLATGKQWELLDTYLEGEKLFIDSVTVGAKTLAMMSPTTGGAVLLYMQAATDSWGAFKERTEIELAKALGAEEKRQQLADEALKYGTLNIRSSPSSADIWIDGEYTELLTPETFKRLDVGDRVITLFKYSKKREVTDSYTFEIEIVPGRKKEVLIHIPEDVTSEEEAPELAEGTETAKLPDFIKAEVTGDYAVDGDTFQTTAGERVRILGIDTPELGRPWADMAKEYTASLIEDKKITLRIQTFLPIDTYGRTLAICESYKGNIAILLLSAGLARAFIAEDATYDPARYLEAERIAKERRIGIWSEMP